MMKDIRGLILSVLTLAVVSRVAGQNNLGKSDDIGRIALSIYVPESVEEMPASAETLLTDRISMLLTNYSLAKSVESGRFVITPAVHMLEKTIAPTIPANYIITIQTSLIIGDVVEGTKFASTSLTSKGVGQSMEKAYIDAIRKIKTQNPDIEAFVSKAKQRIIEYYNSTCDINIKKANTLAGKQEFDEAIFLLTSVPEVCKECYEKSMDNAVLLFQRKVDAECSRNLQQAKSIWSAGQDAAAAAEVAELLANVDPSSKCRAEVEKFLAAVAKRIKEIDKREWDFQLRQQKDDADVRKAVVRAAREVGLAYAKNQPRTIYNYSVVRTWW